MKDSSSRLLFPALIVVLGICLCMTAGCTSDTSDTTPSGATPATTTAPAAGAAGAAGGSVNAVPFATLITFLPAAPAGWTADEPFGITTAIEDGQWTWASRDYTRGDAQATIVIQDSAYYNVGYWGAWNTLTSIETTEGYYKQKTISGYPAWETFDKPDSYTTWVGMDERFMVYVSIEGGSKQDLDTFVNAIDYDGIANLK